MYNVFVVPALSYLWQVFELSPELHAVEKRAPRLTSGPVQWRIPADLCNLVSLVGFPIELQNLRVSALSARLRLSLTVFPDLKGLLCKLEISHDSVTKPGTYGYIQYSL